VERFAVKNALSPVFLLALLLPAAPARTVLSAEEKSLEELAITIKVNKTKSFEQNARAAAIRALAKKNSLQAARIIASCLDDPFVHIQEVAVQSLGKMKNPDVASYLAKTYIHHKNPQVRRNTAKALGLGGQTEALGGLVKALGDRDSKTSVKAARALALIGDASVAEKIERRLGSLKGAPKGEALRCLGILGRLPPAGKLEGFFKDLRWEVRVGLLDGLVAGDAAGTEEFARRGLEDKAFQVRIAALEALVRGASKGMPEAMKAALEGLDTLLKDTEWEARSAAAQLSVELWDAECIPLLVEALEREQKGDRGRLLIDFGRALQVYTGKTIGYDADLWNSWWRAQKDKFTLGKAPKRNRYGVIKSLGSAPKEEKTVVTFFRLPVLSKRVAFVFDLSGSMKDPPEKPKIDIAREKMKETLGAFKKNQWFNVIVYRYYSGFPPETKIERAFPARLMPADPIRKAKAAEFLDRLEPRGWGNFFEAVLAAMEIPEVDTIYFLSDGVPSRGRYTTKTGILENLGKLNRFRRVMIHTVLTGEKGADESFMRDLAGITWGMTTKG